MNDYMKAAFYQKPDFIPISVSILPAAWLRYGQQLQAVRARYPEIFGNVDTNAPPDFYYDPRYHSGKYVDEWGCVWENIKDGYDAIVTGHPLPNREDIHSLKIPEKDVGFPHGFMFLRLTDLRGYEEMMIDFAEQPPELQLLIDKVLEYNMRQCEYTLARTRPGDVVYFGDDNGTQKALPISPKTWRKYLKPSYTKIYRAMRSNARIVYMHTDGCIYEVIPDMIETGVQILNPQIRANGIDKLVETCRGKVCINLDLDRQLFPFATPEEIREHVRECTEAMYLPEGGLMLHAECSGDIPLENIDAICSALVECRAYKG